LKKHRTRRKQRLPSEGKDILPEMPNFGRQADLRERATFNQGNLSAINNYGLR